MKKLILIAILFPAMSMADCGKFDTEQLRKDIASGYFERGGVELSKAVMKIMAKHLDCKSTRKE